MIANLWRGRKLMRRLGRRRLGRHKVRFVSGLSTLSQLCSFTHAVPAGPCSEQVQAWITLHLRILPQVGFIVEIAVYAWSVYYWPLNQVVGREIAGEVLDRKSVEPCHDVE